MSSYAFRQVDVTVKDIARPDPNPMRMMSFDGRELVPMSNHPLAPPVANVKVDTYYPRKVRDTTGAVRLYMVKQSDDGIFNDLFHISNGDIEKIRLEARNDGSLLAHSDIRAQYRKTPFWRRIKMAVCGHLYPTP